LAVLSPEPLPGFIVPGQILWFQHLAVCADGGD
jgi:hypothetical protein